MLVNRWLNWCIGSMNETINIRIFFKWTYDKLGDEVVNKEVVIRISKWIGV